MQALRLLTCADIVGRDRMVAATDCGFGSFADVGAIHPPICFAKLASTAEGAEIVGKELWRWHQPALPARSTPDWRR